MDFGFEDDFGDYGSFNDGGFPGDPSFGNDGGGETGGFPDVGATGGSTDVGFGNNGGSVGDNGAGGGSGEEPGNAGTSGAPTQADYTNLVKQFGTTGANAIMQNVASANPSWASQIGQMLGTAAKTVAGGGSSGGGTGSGGGAMGTTNLSMLLPALATAYQQFNNAGQYKDQSEQYAKTLNPYGVYRDAAAQQLAALQADPSSIVNTPGYKFNLSQGLGAVANRDNRSFGVGAGSTSKDIMDYSSGLASKTYNDTIKQLSDQAGVGIGPGAAASILQTGMQGNIAAQNNAINALMSPFGPGNNTGGNTTDTQSLLSQLFGGSTPTGTPGGYTYDPNNDPGNIVNNQQVPSVPPTSTYPTVPNNNTGVMPGGT